MKISQEILKKANIIPLLRLAIQKEGGGVIGTGPHKVKLLEDKTGRRINSRTGKEEYIVWYFVEEDGQKKKYPVPLKSSQDEVHYLIQRLGELPEGTEVILEYKRKEGSVKGFIDVQLAEGKEPVPASEIPMEEIPIIEEDEEQSGDIEEGEPLADI